MKNSALSGNSADTNLVSIIIVTALVFILAALFGTYLKDAVSTLISLFS